MLWLTGRSKGGGSSSGSAGRGAAKGCSTPQTQWDSVDYISDSTSGQNGKGDPVDCQLRSVAEILQFLLSDSVSTIPKCL